MDTSYHLETYRKVVLGNLPAYKRLQFQEWQRKDRMEPAAIGNVICALVGAAVGGSTMAFFLLWLTKLKGEESMACKAHGECLGCRLDEAEDVARNLKALYEPLWATLNDIEPKLQQKHAQMREYVDEQLRKIEARFVLHSHRMDTLLDKAEKLKK